MKRFLAVACLGLFAVAANANTIEFYFSPTNSVTGVPSEYTNNVNPSVNPGEKVFLWSAHTLGDVWNGVAIMWDQKPGAGVAYNPSFGTPKKFRWETSSDFDPTDDGAINLVAIQALGIGGDDRDPLIYIDEPKNTWHSLVAELVFNTPGDVFLVMEGGGITRQGGTTQEDVYFGRGDPSIKNSAPRGTKTRDKDLTVLPEPASLLLLSLAGLALRRR